MCNYDSVFNAVSPGRVCIEKGVFSLLSRTIAAFDKSCGFGFLFGTKPSIVFIGVNADLIVVIAAGLVVGAFLGTFMIISFDRATGPRARAFV